jgi:RHS repeat-associated protein
MKRAIYAAAIFLAGALDTAAQTTQWTTGAYSYDGSGNVRSITRSPADVDEYTYDAFGRVTKGTVRGGHAQEYTYDAFGNLLTITTDGNTGAVRRPCVGANNQLLPSSSAGCNVTASYDSAGRMLSHSLPSGTYVYDSVDMITQSTIATDAGQRKALHLYTASDERVASIELDASTTPVRREYTVRDAASRVLRRFKQEGTTPVRWDEDYIYRGSQLLAAEVGTADRTRHFHVDHLGTPRLITGNGGVKISLHDYYPFGEEVTAPGDERLKFTGHERDAKTLDYMHARYYSPVWGRFLSVDPLLDVQRAMRTPQLWNRYSYVLNNPINRIDPDGRADVASEVASGVFGFLPGAGEFQDAMIAATGYDPITAEKQSGWVRGAAVATVLIPFVGGKALGEGAEATARIVGNAIAGARFEKAVLASFGLADATKTRIPSLSGTAAYRVPDGFTSRSIIEVKGVARLGATNQIKDFAAFAKENGQQFILVVRKDTVLTKELEKMASDGLVQIQRR